MKAVFVCAGVVEVRSSQSLAEQLSRYGGGFELRTVSNVPQGSGECSPACRQLTHILTSPDPHTHRLCMKFGV